MVPSRRRLAAAARSARSRPSRRSTPQDVIPFDAAVRTATLPNGLKFFIRQNEQPAKRVSLRLAVKAGSIDEADDQQGLAHLIEHMAFNGSAHFKPGELVSTFESIGARLGPHVNAYTSFDETVYMLELPTDKPEIVAKGLTAMADFAGGLTLDPAEVDKERGVVIEEWRGGLGAGSRIRDKQFPVLFYRSRYAERLPIGKPEIIRNAPAARLRAFYDTWYRPDRMAVIVVGDVDAAADRAGHPDAVRAAGGARAGGARARSHGAAASGAARQRRDRSGADAVERAARAQARRSESGQRVADYRRGLVERLVDHMFDERFTELARRPDAKFLGAGAGGGSLSRDRRHLQLQRARVQDGRIAGRAVGARRRSQARAASSGSAPAELDRAKRWMAGFMERAYNERDKTESGSYAQEYLSYFLEDEPSPGIAYEYRLVQQLLPTITAAEVSTFARTLLGDDSRVLLAVSPQKAGVPRAVRSGAAGGAGGGRATSPSRRGPTRPSRATLVENKPAPGGDRVAARGRRTSASRSCASRTASKPG